MQGKHLEAKISHYSHENVNFNIVIFIIIIFIIIIIIIINMLKKFLLHRHHAQCSDNSIMPKLCRYYTSNPIFKTPVV